MDNFMEALKLMGVGLITVFLVLLLIIWIGNLLIKLVNKIAPEEEKVVKKAAPSQSAPIDPQVMQAISKAVELATNGKGRIEKIEKI